MMTDLDPDMPARPRRESWAPGKRSRHLVRVEDQFATVYLPWEYIGIGWRAFAEVEAQRLARRWPGIEMFAWRAEYGGAFVTLRRVG